MNKKKTSYQKLKEQINILKAERDSYRNDLREIVHKNNFTKKVEYSLMFRMEDDFEAYIWYGRRTNKK